MDTEGEPIGPASVKSVIAAAVSFIFPVNEYALQSV